MFYGSGTFFEKNGKGCNAVVGISGGKDSSVVAALCVEALGRDHVIGELMPQGVQPDIEAAYLLVNHLGIKQRLEGFDNFKHSVIIAVFCLFNKLDKIVHVHHSLTFKE